MINNKRHIRTKSNAIYNYIKVINTFNFIRNQKGLLFLFSKLIFIKKYNIIYIKKKGKKRKCLKNNGIKLII